MLTLDERKQRVLDTLAAAEEAGLIYNVDWNDTKDSFNRWIDDTKRAWAEANIETIRRDGGKYNDFYYGTPYANQLPNFVKKIEAKLTKLGYTNDAVLKDLLERLTPMVVPAQTLIALKAKIKMGRKPSDDPTKTPERTLDHTGTCGVCKRNHKRHLVTGQYMEGSLVQHGYNVKWHQFVGGCFGVGYQPVEVDPKVLFDYRDMLQRVLTSNEEALADLPSIKEFKHPNAYQSHDTRKVTQEDGYLFKTAYERAENEITWRITSLKNEIERLTQEITDWKPRTLPDGTMPAIPAKKVFDFLAGNEGRLG